MKGVKSMVNVTKSQLLHLFDDREVQQELFDWIGVLMDQELEKPDDAINFDFIEDCSRALIEVQNGAEMTSEVLLKMMTDARVLKRAKRITLRSLSATAKLAILAAVLLAAGLTVYAGIQVAPKMFAPVEPTTVAIDTMETTTAVAQTSAATKPKATTKATTEPTATTKVMKDDSVFVRSSAKPSRGVYKIVCGAKGHADKCIATTYNRKGYSNDHFTVLDRYTDRQEEAVAFSEKEYMSDYYPENICYAADGAKHKFTAWKQTKSPGCGTLGEKERSCTVCHWQQTCPIRATNDHKWTYELDQFKETYLRMRFECSVCGLARLYKVPSPKTIIVDLDRDYYNSIHPNVIAVLDNQGYEIPRKYWSVDPMALEPAHEPGLECLAIIFNGKGPYPEHYVNVQAYLPCHPPQPKFKAIATQKGGMQVQWKGSPDYYDLVVSGFQVEYATDAEFKNSKRASVSGHKRRSLTVDGLVSGKTYYVRLRGYYRNDDNQNLYGLWSDVRAVKIQ